ncbi:TetR/AcrR family transcriptional regulator [Clostridium cellulovorans]|uniref:Transcriptional regulator, TetR family n=1 Tax=Clostridium cellulovorans (strain ATCC 35296 / DSM 3052 / OCM 3 / 743B) TaxID=573061 RepID=D9SM91_CLOC7|nr:TetR/AcrR family transcriptional regulator [Clostridium cellulovorans]ADL53747.1 transcriptional regulator, TetR family [Clostridium cellulovorans 743B]
MVDNKKNILASALELFYSRGYDAVGVQEIVNTAGVTKPTLYHYFGNKEGLLYELIKENHERLMEMVKVASLYQRDLSLTLHRLTSSYFKFALSNSKFYRLLMAMRFYPPDSEPFKVSRAFMEAEVEVIEELFLNASMDHGNMVGRQHIYAVTYLGMVNSYILAYDNENKELDEEVTYRAIHQFMHGIYS